MSFFFISIFEALLINRIGSFFVQTEIFPPRFQIWSDFFDTTFQSRVIHCQSDPIPQKWPKNAGFWPLTTWKCPSTPKYVPYYHNTVSTHVLGHTRVHSTHFPWLGTVKRAPKHDPAAPQKSRFTTVSPETSPYQSEMPPSGAIPSL